MKIFRDILVVSIFSIVCAALITLSLVRYDKYDIDRKIEFLFGNSNRIVTFEYFYPDGQFLTDHIIDHDGGWNLTVLSKELSGYSYLIYTSVDQHILVDQNLYNLNISDVDNFLQNSADYIAEKLDVELVNQKKESVLFRSLFGRFYSIENVEPPFRVDYEFHGKEWETYLEYNGQIGRMNINLTGTHHELVLNTNSVEKVFLQILLISVVSGLFLYMIVRIWKR